MTPLHLIEVRLRTKTATKPDRLRLYSHDGYGSVQIPAPPPGCGMIDAAWAHLQTVGLKPQAWCTMSKSLGGILCLESGPLEDAP